MDFVYCGSDTGARPDDIITLTSNYSVISIEFFHLKNYLTVHYLHSFHSLVFNIEYFHSV